MKMKSNKVALEAAVFRKSSLETCQVYVWEMKNKGGC